MSAPPIAVFLGPSMPVDEASPLLEARYLPPAQFGHIYRLIGGDVRVIVLLDGVFHGRAPVWQREILCAIESGIRVYGASSMGALRAAELSAHGMIGVGTIYTWYATGEIDGDDEVALLHTGPEQRYRPMTMPLVNLRVNLRNAAARGVIPSALAAMILADLKALPFWERSREALWEAPSFRAMDAPLQTSLRAFFEREAIDLKRQDAALALAEVARRESDVGPRPARTTAPTTGASYHDHHRLLERMFPQRESEPVLGRALVDRVLADPARRRLVRWSLAARFFALRWALEREDIVSAAAREAEPTHAPSDEALRERALTAVEHDALHGRSALVSWLLDQPPTRFGLAPTSQDEGLFASLPEMDVEGLRPLCAREAIARALPYVAAWCEWAGAAPPPDVHAKLQARYPSAGEPFLHAVWAIERGPVYFGFTTWTLAAELLTALQMMVSLPALAGLHHREGV